MVTATAGYNTTVYITGTPTTITNEATTELSAGPPQVFRISDATKRVLDADTAVVVKDQDLVDVTSDFTIDFLAGKVTSATGGYASVVISGKFLPMLAVAEGRSASAAATNAELDVGVFGEAYSKVICGKQSASGEIVTLAPLTDDLDAGGGTRSWQAVFEGATQVVIDTRMTTTSTVRAWTRIPSLTTKSEQAGLVESTIAWKSISKRAVTQNTECGFTIINPT